LSGALAIPGAVEYELYRLLEERMAEFGGLVAFSVRLDVRGVLHNPSGAHFRIEDDDNVTLSQDPRFFHGFDLPGIEAGAKAAVQRERARERSSAVIGEFAWIRA
jgi:hypothetical protein